MSQRKGKPKRAATKEANGGKITKDMTLGELVVKYPEAAQVMLKHGMHCIGCHMSAMETVAEGAAGHGIVGKEFDKLIEEMNEAVK
jgi:hybrid cluster-associated redox disulfide protein